MKSFRITFLASLAVVFSCSKVYLEERIEISSPEPQNAISKITLTDIQKGYVKAGNAFAFNCLKELYDSFDGTFVFSPLSLQYALAMATNGASGETADEITGVLGYGSDIKALNEYCNLLLNQLPAVDTDITLRLLDAILVNDKFEVQDSYKNLINNSYYAPVEYIKTADKDYVVNRINEWASRNTHGLIPSLLDKTDLSDNFAAAILNGIYFKAKWWGNEYNPMFLPEETIKNQPFYYDGGGEGKVDYMIRDGWRLPYCVKNGYRVVGIPYSSEKYYFYIILPDEKGTNGLKNTVDKLKNTSWNDIQSSLQVKPQVYLRLPKFEAENKFYLKDALVSLGIRKAFTKGEAEFDNLFKTNDSNWYFWIENAIQKAKISVTEYGTEAAAVTHIEIAGATDPGPGELPEEVEFYADHPFVYVIGEKTSGTILFEGIFDGK